MLNLYFVHASTVSFLFLLIGRNIKHITLPLAQFALCGSSLAALQKREEKKRSPTSQNIQRHVW